MAIIDLGILGPVKNKVGPVVGFMWSGLNVLRSYVIPANPRTVRQTTQRNKFSVTVQMAKSIITLPALKYFWNLAKGTSRTAFAKCVSELVEYSGTTAPTGDNQILPQQNTAVGLATATTVTGSALTSTIPALDTVVDPHEGASQVTFPCLICYSDPVNEGYDDFVMTTSSKVVEAYNFMASYSLSIPLTPFQVSLGSLYQKKTVFMAAVIQDEAGNNLQGIRLGNEVL